MLELRMQDPNSSIWQMQLNHSMLSCENKIFVWMWPSLCILETVSTSSRTLCEWCQIGFLRTGMKLFQHFGANVGYNHDDPDMRQWWCYCPWPLKRPLLPSYGMQERRASNWSGRKGGHQPGGDGTMNGAKKQNNEQKAAEKAVKDCSRKRDHTQYRIVVDLYYMLVVFIWDQECKIQGSTCDDCGWPMVDDLWEHGYAGIAAGIKTRFKVLHEMERWMEWP